MLQAEKKGEITALERNRLIQALNALEREALARLRRDARDGRLSAQELQEKAAAVELEFEGP